MKYVDLNLDRTFVHEYNNCDKLKQMCKVHPGNIVFEIDGCNAAYQGGH